MRISLIIPIYNESKTISACLSQLDNLPGDWEILFADGGCTDDTLQQIGERYPVLSCPKGRAKQMNHAAQQATADFIWFVHCDSLLPNAAHAQISEAAAKAAVFGCFSIGFDYDGPFMGCNTYFSNRRAAKRHIAFGDQGIWIKKDLFLQQGGFPDLPIMEDYEFSLRMRKQKIPLTVLSGKIITSGRRYRTRFPLWTMWQMFYLRILYRMGVDIYEISRRYKDIR